MRAGLLLLALISTAQMQGKSEGVIMSRPIDVLTLWMIHGVGVADVAHPYLLVDDCCCTAPNEDFEENGI